jgi:alpha-tubulin suppressor-like RCC1 family protein
LFSWGAGESGQLGTGRCTIKEIPSEVVFNQDQNVTVSDVACGDGHVMAVLDNGNMYSWGLNHRGQCGLGDIKARHTPTLIDTKNIAFTKLTADKHSSAAIDSKGMLYTWGSATNERLLIPIEQPELSDDPTKNNPIVCIMRPTKVESDALEGMEVEKFLFTDSSAAVLVKATLTKVNPSTLYFLIVFQ